MTPVWDLLRNLGSIGSFIDINVTTYSVVSTSLSQAQLNRGMKAEPREFVIPSFPLTLRKLT